MLWITFNEIIQVNYIKQWLNNIIREEYQNNVITTLIIE